MDDKRKRDLSTADLASTRRERENDAVGGTRPIEHDFTRISPRTEEEAHRAEQERERERERERHPAGQHDRFMPPGAPSAHDDTELPALLEPPARDDLRREWESIQTGFVDEPRRAVEQADHLVASTVQRLAESFARQREQLETQWSRDGDVSTEDLRLALRRYRAFFDRMLSL